METKKFIDVLEIYNGKNQKAVENPDGKYPIYGSGGVMGRADEYICPAETVVWKKRQYQQSYFCHRTILECGYCFRACC